MRNLWGACQYRFSRNTQNVEIFELHATFAERMATKIDGIGLEPPMHWVPRQVPWNPMLVFFEKFPNLLE